MRKAIYLWSAVLALCVGLVPAANAFTISVVPRDLTPTQGGLVTVDVVASGLVAGAAPSLGAYDIDFTYDSGAWSFNSAGFGTGLDPAGRGDLGTLQIPGADTPGTVNMFEVSFYSVNELNQMQGDAFTLFTVSLLANAPGTSTFGLNANSLSSSEGDALTADLVGASVTVAPVPLPAAAWLFLSGLAGAAGLGRKRLGS